jgi:signal transduction histidine kinase
MPAASVRNSEEYRRYRQEIERDLMGPSLWVAVRVTVALNIAFILSDRLAFPEHFRSFLAVRLASSVLIGAFGYWGGRRWPVVAAFAACWITGGMLLWVIYGAGGAASEYSPGLMLLFVGIPVLLPFSAPQATAIVSVLFAIYAASPWLTAGPVEWREYLLHACFPLAAAVECVASTAVVDGIRFRDFCQRSELERARDDLQQLDKAKSRFTANVHHELRTPLTLVLAPLEAMLGGEFGEIGEQPRRYLYTMQVNALRLLKLINNLLDLAKAESKELRLRRRALDLGPLLREVVAGARPLAERKGVSLETVGLEGLPTIHADPDALEKIVMNLLGNALKFTDPGGRIVVSAELENADGVRIGVTDTGAGIPPEQLERIFDRFAQVDTSATRKYEGTGIGLSLVKELVELHGGRVWAESEGLGHGARFYVTLPPGEEEGELEDEVLQTDTGRGVPLGRSLGALEAELNLSAGGEGSGEETGYRHAALEHTVARWEAARSERLEIAPTQVRAAEIVVVEDNGEMRRLLAHLLSREFHVREARNGREALDCVREHAPDLVLTDVMMPEMSGTELCRALKSAPETRSIPVVLVTSKAEREMKVRGLELGADDYVTKPFHPRELLARVRSLVRLHRLQAQLEERNRALEEANHQLERTLRELKAAEVHLVQSERLAAVGELAAGVAHEVNNPVNFALNAVRMLKSHVTSLREIATAVGALELDDATRLAVRAKELERLRDELGVQELAQELAELVEIATEGLERTQRLVGDLKDFAGPQRAPHGSVDLERCMRSTVQLLGHSLQRAGVRVGVRIDSGLPRVRGDEGALNQVFLNLLKNAGEALETRGGEIGVEARAEGATVVVEIRDDGPGVAAEVRARLFEPFVSTKETGRGTGLGLSISHRIVKEHGGTLELRSGPGEGAVFMIRLPAEERDAS